MVETKGVIKDGDPKIYIAQTILQRIVKQTKNMSEEGVAGLFIGERCSWAGREYTRVDDILPFLMCRSASSLVSDEAWLLEIKKATTFAGGGKAILGWWGVQHESDLSLQGAELRLQKLFFDRPWMFCSIIDPITEKLGNFGWKAGRVVSVGFRLVMDETVEA